MLVLARKEGEEIRIGDEIVITVLPSNSGQIRLGIEAPSRITIHREEIYDKIALANRQATATMPTPLADSSPSPPSHPVVPRFGSPVIPRLMTEKESPA